LTGVRNLIILLLNKLLFNALDASTLTITSSMRFTLNVNAIIIKIYATKYTILFRTHIISELSIEKNNGNIQDR
jgi:hypothetical protein